MKDFINYINAITKQPIFPKKAKMTTTILMPQLDTTEGIYRSLLPAYVINGTDKELRVLVIGISPKADVSNNGVDFHITHELISETDHFVFPFVSFPLRPIVEEIRKVKPEMKFSYYIDFNYYLVPEAFPFSKEYKGKEIVKVIEDNIRVVDQVICTNNTLIDYIIAKIKENYPGVKFGTDFCLQKLYLLPDLMKTEYTNEAPRGQIKALIIGDEYQFSDINYVAGILKDFKCKYKEAFKLSIIGWNGMRKDKNYLNGIEFDHFERVPFNKYYELIRHIGPTVLIIPATKSKFNDTSKNYIKYLEFAQMNIPVIGPYIAPYTEIINTNENGFLCEDKDAYNFQLETMFTEPAKYENVCGIAYAAAVEQKITKEENIEKLRKIYFPNYVK